MNDFLLSILLGVVEGLTEFLPVSSTGHLRIVEALFKLNLHDSFWKMYTIVIQLGAILALPVYFREQILRLVLTFPVGERGDRSHLRQRGRNGEELLVSMALIPVRDDRGIVAACAVISDGTERVHEAERRYRALVEALPLVTLISAPNDRSSVSVGT